MDPRAVPFRINPETGGQPAIAIGELPRQFMISFALHGSDFRGGAS